MVLLNSPVADVPKIVEDRVKTIQVNGLPVYLSGTMEELRKLISVKTTKYPIILLLSHKERNVNNGVWSQESSLKFILATFASEKPQSEREITSFVDVLRPLQNQLISCLNLPADKDIYVVDYTRMPEYESNEYLFDKTTPNNLNLTADAIELNIVIKILRKR